MHAAGVLGNRAGALGDLARQLHGTTDDVAHAAFGLAPGPLRRAAEIIGVAGQDIDDGVVVQKAREVRAGVG